MTRGHYSHLDNYEKGNTVPLYEVRNNTWIIWAGCRIFFEKIDGMYSICKDANGDVLHLAAFTEVTIDE